MVSDTSAVLLPLLEKHGLMRLAEMLLNLARPAIRIHAQATNEADISIGASKFGGLPDLPPGTEWPFRPEHVSPWPHDEQDDGGPMCFLAQIRCEDIAPFDPEGLLPRTGLFVFFAALWANVINEHPNTYRAFYYEDLNSLQRTPYPAPLPEGYFHWICSNGEPHPSCGKLEFSNLLTVPPFHSEHLPSDLTDTERNSYYGGLMPDLGLSTEVFDNEGNHSRLPLHYMLGYAQFNYQNIQETQGMTLLLQMDTQDDLSLGWEFGGRGYFLIAPEDLRQRRFDNITLFWDE